MMQHLYNLWSVGNEQNNVQLAVISVFNFSLVGLAVYFECVNSKFLVKKVGIIYYVFHAGMNVISLADWFPYVELDRGQLLKFDYLQISLFSTALILNTEFSYLIFICFPSYLAIEYWRGLLHLEYNIWITQVSLHFMRACAVVVLLAFYCYRN
jgi:hypothetical protein